MNCYTYINKSNKNIVYKTVYHYFLQCAVKTWVYLLHEIVLVTTKEGIEVCVSLSQVSYFPGSVTQLITL